MGKLLLSTSDHCGAHVSDRFDRAFTDATGVLHACPSNTANAGISEVARERATAD